MANLRCDFVFWDVAAFTDGKFSLGWNWGWGYYRALKEMGLANYGGLVKNYKHAPSDVVIITDGIHLCLKDRTFSEAFIKKIKADKKKLVVIVYESIFKNDNPVMASSKSKNFMTFLQNNSKWNFLMKNADLLALADPHDVFVINNNDKYEHYPKTIYSPLAVDEKIFTPQSNMINKACFIGSLWICKRKKVINTIPSGIIDIPQILHKGDSYAAALASTQNYVKTLGKYSVNLNLRTIFAGLQLRIYETMALGRVCLSHRPINAEGREDLYKGLKSVVWYDNTGLIPGKIANLIGDPKKSKEIGARARKEIISAHTHKHRIKNIIGNL